MKKLLRLIRSPYLLLKINLKMKLSMLFLLVTFFTVHANDTYGQRTKVSLDLEDVTIEKLLDEIESKTEFEFVYRLRDVDLKRKISITVNEETIDTVLDQIFQNTKTSYNLTNKRVYLIRKKEIDVKVDKVDVVPEIIIQQSVSGTVTDENGQPLPGANIIEKGTTNGTQADFDGNYFLTLETEDAVLVFSYIGFKKQERTIGQATTISVQMAADSQGLDEVVVVGYGSVRKSDLTGSVAVISEEDIQSMPITTVDQALQGRAAGVQVTQADAAPGGAVSIRIRGGSSINNSNEPLYVVDGFPTTDISNLNPSDISSIQILKDASATAIYGARGANGVVIIGTLSGKAGQSSLEVTHFTGVQTIANKIDVLNGQQFAELANEAFIQDGRDVPFENPAALGEGTDWQDAIYRTALMSNTQIAFRKGTESTRYAVTGNYFSQDGIVITSKFQRVSARFNLESDINDKLTFGNNISFTHITNNEVLVNDGGRGGAGVVHNALTVTPDLPIFDENGDYFINSAQIGPGFRRDNPVALAENTTNETSTTRFLGNAFLSYALADGLTAKISVGADITSEKLNRYIGSQTFRGFFERGIARVQTRNTTNILNENTLNYKKELGKDNLDVLVGLTFQRENFEQLRASGNGFPNDILKFNDLSVAEVLDPSQTDAGEWALASYLGRINYSLQDKFLFTLTGRIDGSSRFGADSKYGFFPSGAVAWKLSNEKFIQNLDVFDQFKFRASYGVTGFQEIGLYRSLSRLGISEYAINDQRAVGISPIRIPNPDLKWERTGQFNIGLDLGFLDNRLRFTLDYYRKETQDLLLDLPVPYTSGFAISTQNIGSTENKGFDIAVSANVINTNNFNWNIDANYSRNRNEVLNLGGLQEFFGPNSGSNGFYNPPGSPAILVREGEPVNSFFGYVADGLFRTQDDIDNGPTHRFMELGDLRFKDIDGDGGITPDDRAIIGNAQPDFIFGFNNSFNYKDFDLGIFIQGVIGNDILNAYRLYELTSLRGVHNNLAEVVDRYTPDNIDARYPKADRRGQEQFVSSLGIEDGSFIRLRNISLGYNLPVNNISTIKKARIYISGQNLLTITNYTGYDPEVNSFGRSSINQGIDYGAYPRAKTVTLGVNLNF